MKCFSQTESVFHERELPEPDCLLAGYSYLIDTYKLSAPLPEKCAAISKHHKRYETDYWAIFTPRHTPANTLIGHLTFALKYEGVDLAVLKTLFTHINPDEIVAWVRAEPVGRYSRRIWFFYEWLLETQLDLTDAKTGNLVDALDPKQQYTGQSTPSRRHRVRNNLPGNVNFCPLVRVTEKLKKYINLHISVAAHNVVKQTQHDLLARASAFLLLKDSRASFAIEREEPTQERAARWGDVLGTAGQRSLSKEEVLRLQTIVLEESRFITLGFRTEGGFIGMHNRATGDPVPDHISARAEDLDRLFTGIMALCKQNTALDPIILATVIAFGFVFIHPLADGNGRIHRYLIQHILTEKKFLPPGIVFPISAIILEHIDEYRKVLEAYSQPRLKYIQWRSTNRGNIEVLNETIDLYRYFDATRQAEFLYDCINQAITQSFPEEIAYLERYDRMKEAIRKLVQMPDTRMSLLISFLQQNHGILSGRARSEEFKALSVDECQKIEMLYATILKH